MAYKYHSLGPPQSGWWAAGSVPTVFTMVPACKSAASCLATPSQMARQRMLSLEMGSWG